MGNPNWSRKFCIRQHFVESNKFSFELKKVFVDRKSNKSNKGHNFFKCLTLKIFPIQLTSLLYLYVFLAPPPLLGDPLGQFHVCPLTH